MGHSATPPVPMTEPTTAPTVPRAGDDAAAAAPAEAASVAVTAAAAEHVSTQDLAGGPGSRRTAPPAPPPPLATPLKPRPQRRPETVAPPRSAEDGGDASAVIDW